MTMLFWFVEISVYVKIFLRIVDVVFVNSFSLNVDICIV